MIISTIVFKEIIITKTNERTENKQRSNKYISIDTSIWKNKERNS